MKITICEPCYLQKPKTVTETNRTLRIKGKSLLNTDVCDKHADEMMALTMPDYVRKVYEIQGIKLTENDAEIMEKFLR